MNSRIATIACYLLILRIPAQAQWVQTGPYGGDFSALAVSGTYLFAGGDGGVYRSTDNGNSWKMLPGSPAGAVAFAVSGSNLFAGFDGVYLSTDSGTTWSYSGLMGYQNVTAFAVIGTTIFAGTDDSGVFRSTNNGTNWVAVNSGLQKDYWGDIGARTFAVIGKNIFVDAVGGIFLSTNNGESWSETSSDISSSLLTVMGTNLFAGGNGVYRSTNNGVNWKEVKSGLTDTLVFALVAYGTTLFAGTLYDGVFRSTDSGDSWTKADSGLPINPYVQAFAESGTSLFSSVSGLGLFRSSDTGTSWKASSNGLVGMSVTALVSDGTNLYGVEEGGASTGICVSTDSGATWNLVDTSLIEDITALAVSGSNLYAAYDDLYLTTDRGMSWTIDTGLSTVTIIGNTTIYYTISALGVLGMNLFAELYGGGLYRSTDGGVSWSSADSGLNEENVISFAEIGSKLFVGVQGNGVYRSTDNGTSWTLAGLSDEESINAIAVSGTNLFAATGNVITNGGVFRSTDSGTSWTVENTGLTDTTVTALMASGTNLFAGTRNGGVFLTTNNGASWTNVGFDSVGAIGPDVGITGFAIIGSDLYTATGIDESNNVAAGVWRRPLSEMIPAQSTVTEVPSSSINESISAFPNPATNIITISSSAGPFSILDPLGRSYEVKQSGNTLDVSALPSGVYFVSDGQTRAKFVKE